MKFAMFPGLPIRSTITMVAYTAFDGTVLELIPWAGQHVAYLVPEDRGFDDPATLQFLVSATDAAYEWYAATTGLEPTPYAPTQYAGLSTVAFVPETCGFGCGYLGFTGIEFLQDVASGTGVYDLAGQGLIHQAVLYELGRNFWFYGEEIGAIEGFTTGFAIANRFIAGESIGFEPGGDLLGMPYKEAQQYLMVNLLEQYLADPDASWRLLDEPDGTITIQGQEVGAADLAGAFFYRIHADCGAEAYSRFWRSLEERPAAESEEEARDNFLAAAQEATGRDYIYLFKEEGSVVDPPWHTPGSTGDWREIFSDIVEAWRPAILPKLSELVGQGRAEEFLDELTRLLDNSEPAWTDPDCGCQARSPEDLIVA
jgi:hypothetical protein